MLPASPRLLAVVVLLLTGNLVRAEPSLSDRIDQAIRAGLKDYDRKAARPADDAEFFRRVALDLTGVIPTSADVRAFLADKAADKRVKLVDRLLASDAYARHLQHTFDVLLLDRRPDKHVKRAEWHAFLRASFAANKPYDQLVREILSADGSDPKARAAAGFYLNREGEPHQLTKDISRLFLGMNLHCAQCHDHPIVNAFKQDHYYGVFAFLNRSYLYTDKAKKLTVYAEKAEGDVDYESVFVPKVKKKTGPRLPGGELLTEPKLKKGEGYVRPVKKGERGIPKYSRRAQLAGAVTENRLFARSAVNRLWSLCFGRGIIHPVEFDHPENPPSHPELLDLLTDEFQKQKYDVKGLLRAIVLSQTYQRSSEAPPDGKDLDPKYFAVAELRPLTPEQLAWSLLQATGQRDAERQALGKKATEAALYAKLSAQAAPIGKLFSGTPGEPDSGDFETTLDQTLFLNNGDLLRNWLTPRPGNLLDRLTKLKDTEPIAEELYLSVLSRRPDAEERQDVAAYLARRENRTAALQELAWALLASAEFRFNH